MYDLNFGEWSDFAITHVTCEIYTTLAEAVARAESLTRENLVEISDEECETVAVYSYGRLIPQAA